MLSQRAVSDAVLVSVGTALKEKYDHIRLNESMKSRRHELGLSDEVKLVVSTQSSERLPVALEISDYVVTTSAAIKALQVSPSSPEFAQVIIAGETAIDWNEALTQLNERGLVRIICEGGPSLIDQLIQADLLDQLALTTSSHDGALSTEFAAINNFIDSEVHTEIYKSDGFTFEFIGQLATWEQKLSPEEFYVLRRGGTQAPFAVPYEKKPAPGYYTCRACGARLFDADTQFDARCGWPAFWKPSDTDAVRLLSDNSMGMRRVEVRCKACDSHLGHVFEGEGFGFETDQRYCINSICLVRHQE